MGVAWKHLILSFMERYFYLICFATYALEHGPGGYEKSFQAYMDEHKELRTMMRRAKTSSSGTGRSTPPSWSTSRRSSTLPTTRTTWAPSSEPSMTLLL